MVNHKPSKAHHKIQRSSKPARKSVAHHKKPSHHVPRCAITAPSIHVNTLVDQAQSDQTIVLATKTIKNRSINNESVSIPSKSLLSTTNQKFLHPNHNLNTTTTTNNNSKVLTKSNHHKQLPTFISSVITPITLPPPQQISDIINASLAIQF